MSTIDLGFQPSAYVVSVICGNWWQESGINPGIWEGLVVGAPGYGLGQWTGSRRTALFNWLDYEGYKRDSGSGQIAFFIHENTWYRNGYGENFDNLEDFLRSDSTDLQLLTYAFMQGWEGIWDGTEGIRLEAAQKCYEYILLHAEDEPKTGFFKGNRYLSEAERLHNAVMVFRAIGGKLTGGGGFPVWMMIRYH